MKSKNDIESLLQTFINLGGVTIPMWVNAKVLATKTYLNKKPQKFPLIDVYDKVLDDPHLSALIQQRKSRVLGEDFEIYKNGEVNDELTALVNKEWLQQFMYHAFMARLYGYSLIEVTSLDVNGEIEELYAFDRRHVIPELGFVLKTLWNYEDVISFDDKGFDMYLIHDTSTPLGLLNKAVPAVIRKMYHQTSWVDHAQIAGLPLLFGKLKDATPERSAELVIELMNMARRGVGVGGDGDTVEVINRSGSGHDIYKSGVELENSELTKLIMSQTGTTEANSSHAQSETHKTVADELAEEDKVFCANAFNKFIPKLIQLGYPLEGCTGYFKKDVTFDDGQTKMLTELLKYYTIDEQVIKDSTGIDVEARITKQSLPKE